jgi:hypothetical protein
MREALLTSARQEVAAAERSQSNNPRRGAVALLKSVYLSAAQGKDWDAEKALRQVCAGICPVCNLLSCHTQQRQKACSTILV